MPTFVARKVGGRIRTVEVDPVTLEPRRKPCSTMVSVNAGIAPHRAKEGDKMMHEAGVNARFDRRTGNMIVEGGRREYLKALKARGLVNLDEVAGGRSRE